MSNSSDRSSRTRFALPTTQAERDKLELRFMRSSCPSLATFAKRHGMNPVALRRVAQGWEMRRRRLRLGHRSLPDAPVARTALLSMWWELSLRLGECVSGGLEAQDDLKNLAAAAGVLKTAHAGLAGLLPLDETDAPLSLSIEGVNADAF